MYQAKIIDSIRALRLTHFRLFVHYDIDLEEDVYYGPYSKDLVLSIAELDHAHVAAQLMGAVPSLVHVLVSSGGQFELFPDERHSKRGRWFAHSAWKRVSGGPPEKLDEDVMERMLREQDLGLSHRDEVSSVRCLRIVLPSHICPVYSSSWDSRTPGPPRRQRHGPSRTSTLISPSAQRTETTRFCRFSRTPPLTHSLSPIMHYVWGPCLISAAVSLCRVAIERGLTRLGWNHLCRQLSW